MTESRTHEERLTQNRRDRVARYKASGRACKAMTALLEQCSFPADGSGFCTQHRRMIRTIQRRVTRAGIELHAAILEENR